MSVSHVTSPLPAAEYRLHGFCGKAGAGKSTLAHRLAQDYDAILISEDAWLKELYAGEMNSLADYIKNAARLKTALAGHVIQLLGKGLTVVLDFPMNTVAARAWARDIADSAGAPFILHYLDVADDTCLARINSRNALGEHPFQLSEGQFRQITAYFAAPDAGEGIAIAIC